MRRALVLSALLLAGCVSAFPEEAVRGADRGLTVGILRLDPERYVGRRVLVGGEILETRPRPGETEIEVLSRRLTSADSPERSDRSDGRFLVRTSEFLDPAVYAQGRRITVLGTVASHEERKIGDLPYRYPVIAAERIRLWPREVVEAPAFHPGYPWGWYDWPYSYRWPYPYRHPYYLLPPPHPRYWPPYWW